MRSLLDVVAFRYWLVSLVVLFAKMYANSVVQGLARFRHRAFAWPEDARLIAGGDRNLAYQLGVLVCIALAVHIVILLLTVRPS